LGESKRGLSPPLFLFPFGGWQESFRSAAYEGGRVGRKTTFKSRGGGLIIGGDFYRRKP